MDEGPRNGMKALTQAEWLREMFESCALQAAERRIAYSIDRQDIPGAMFFLDVYSYVNGGDVLPSVRVSPIAPQALSQRMVPAGGQKGMEGDRLGNGPHFNQREARSRSGSSDG